MKFRHHVRLACGIGALAVLVPACSYSTQPSSVYPSSVAVEGVKVTPQTIQFGAIGETRRVTATVAPANATDRVVTWESSDPTIATVDATGLVTARAVGAGVFITAVTHDGGHQASAVVVVNPE